MSPGSSSGAAGVGCVVVAAGSGSRLGADRPKAFVDLGGMPLLVHAVRRVLAGGVGHVVAVVPADLCDEASALVSGALAGEMPDGSAASIQVVPGGALRQDSVSAGLAALPDEVAVVLVHDAARCLAPASLVAAVVAAVRGGAVAALPGLPVTDTVKEVGARMGGGETVVRTVDRGPLRAVQTPQGFDRGVLQRAHASRGGGTASASSTGATAPASAVFTDDAEMVEALGETVVVIPGDPLALKITTPADLAYAQWLLASSGQ